MECILVSSQSVAEFICVRLYTRRHLLRKMRIQTQTCHVVLSVQLGADTLYQTLHGLVHILLEFFRVDERLIHGLALRHTFTLSRVEVFVVVRRTVPDVVTFDAAAFAHEVRRQVVVALARLAGAAAVTSRPSLITTRLILIVVVSRPVEIILSLGSAATTSLIVRFLEWFHKIV